MSLDEKRSPSPGDVIYRNASLLIHKLFLEHRMSSILAATGLYLGTVLVLGRWLAISNNYFVILPMVTAAFAFGFSGGVIAGIFALPANLVLFAILDHPEFSPASKPIAEASGIIVGTLFGLLADYFRRLDDEISRRKEIETSLRKALADKEILLDELHHRVKNNLNVVISLIRLQRNRTDDPKFVESADELIRRVFAISLVHDRLYRSAYSAAVDPADYIPELLKEIASFFKGTGVSTSFSVQDGIVSFPIDTAIAIGLFLNEAVTNAMKHAFDGVAEPRIDVALSRVGDQYELAVKDNGKGFAEYGEGDGATPAGGLGMRILAVLAKGLRGSFAVDCNGGTRFVLRFPRNAEEGHGSGGSRPGPPPFPEV